MNNVLKYNNMITAKRSSNIHEDTVLERNGMRNDGTFGVIDDLSVNYDGNRLLNVTDDAESLNCIIICLRFIISMMNKAGK